MSKFAVFFYAPAVAKWLTHAIVDYGFFPALIPISARNSGIFACKPPGENCQLPPCLYKP